MQLAGGKQPVARQQSHPVGMALKGNKLHSPGSFLGSQRWFRIWHDLVDLFPFS